MAPRDQTNNSNTRMALLTFLLLALCWGCHGANNKMREDRPPPDYNLIWESSYSLTVELTVTNENTTMYLEEAHERRLYHDMMSDTQGVRVLSDGYYNTYHFFPFSEGNMFVDENEYMCNGTGQSPGFAMWGWHDSDLEYGANYGPSSILRMPNILTPTYVGADDNSTGILCEVWSIQKDDVEVEFFYSQRNSWISPDANWFPDGGGQQPVEFRVTFGDGSMHIYSVVYFYPWIHHHSILEPTRGAGCEALVGVQTDAQVPKIPTHFSMAEEIVLFPEIDGVTLGAQHIDKILMTYAGQLSLVSLLVPGPVDLNHAKSYTYKVIHDFNTGVQYVLSSEYGNCSMDFIPANSFDTHYGGFLGTGGSMLGPNELFHIDDTYAFVGERGSRSLKGDRWTSTRVDDIPDPWVGDIQTLPKAVLEYYFSTGEELTPSGERVQTDLPFRGDLYLYNKSDPAQVLATITANFYDFRVLNLVSEGEFSVEECYERHSDRWSYLDIYFPADHDEQFAAAQESQKAFKDAVIMKLVEIGRISPVRIASVDIQVGVSGLLPNTTNADTIVAKVKLLERAPFIYSYSKPTDEPMEKPGINERLFDDVHSSSFCADLCSTEKNFDCKSFHHCDDHACYLSRLDTADGTPIAEEVSHCDHWVNTITNQTFPDYPTSTAFQEILNAIEHGEFIFEVPYQDHTVGFEASVSIVYRSPDPMDPVRVQFSTKSYQTTLVYPEVEFKVDTTDECLLACTTWKDFRCETAVHQPDDTQNCQLSSMHYDDMNETMLQTQTHSYLHARSYLSDYSPVLGGVSINTTGPAYDNIEHVEDCARLCHLESTISCQSFEWCYVDNICHLHSEHFLDVVDGGDYTTGTSCIHFSAKTDQIFTRYPNQGLEDSQHHIVARHTSADSCAKMCVEATDKVCQSFDYCSECSDEDAAVCGANEQGPASLCFLAEHHVGESGFKLVKATKCDHYSRDLFGEKDYASWVASQRKSDTPYTAGAMTGLAFGMIFLGILLVVGSLLVMNMVKPEAVHKDLTISLGSMGGSSESR